jgi:histidinol phosphatase-like PHP family hydrolase
MVLVWVPFKNVSEIDWKKNFTEKPEIYVKLLIAMYIVAPVKIWAHFDLVFSTETAEPNYTKPGRDGPWVGPFQNCFWQGLV